MIYLASQSPRRQELLQQIDVAFEVISVSIDETPLVGESPEPLVKRLALSKAQAGFDLVQQTSKALHPVLGSDTIVVIENKILGKPESREHYIDMFTRLSGRTHQVMTAVALVSFEKQSVIINQSLVTFRQLSDKDVEWYWQTGEPQDKAGGYGVQGKAAVFIQKLEGSYTGVMGLPLFETAKLLNEFN